MTELLHVQIALKAPSDAIYTALTDNLADWFAEYADVSTTALYNITDFGGW